MSRLISILLSGFILIQSFQITLEDIMQIDELIEHAKFHKQEYGDNFFVFLSKHYGELKAEHSKNHQEEQTDHEQLPFQFQGQSTIVFAFLSSNCNTDFTEFKINISAESNFHYLNLYASLHEEDLLQPPRQA
ncbi:hypothetical protein [Winogradskyella sp.]|uniref:hypothetical protein n=1 Tax=Winogradskyella sp. TaxID=1883156 RepID=UPI0026278373|nr:hypothetical protein [Winogradskyella sp.]